jgi:DNA-directed RNA polymerase subunit RPC12/RpoP
LTGFVEVGTALLEISDRRLYRATHSTFQDYVSDKWKMTARRAYQLCEAAEVVKALPENVNHGTHLNERQARELAKVKPEKRTKVLETVARKGKVTAKTIKEAAGQSVTRLKCGNCEETFEDDTEAEPLYECGDCGNRFTSGTSADGEGNRCPDCNKFGSKVTDLGCPSCNEGELQPEDETPPPSSSDRPGLQPGESIGGIKPAQYFAVQVEAIVDQAIAANASAAQLKALSLACQAGAKRTSEAARRKEAQL